jgi:hypothetical protein
MRDFAEVIGEVAGGELNEELSQTLTKVMDELESRALATQTKAKGKITLVLSFAVEPKGLVSIDGDVTSKTPKPLRQGDHFYLLKGGKLSRKNPRQQELTFRDAADDGGKAVVREISAVKAEVRG